MSWEEFEYYRLLDENKRLKKKIEELEYKIKELEFKEVDKSLEESRRYYNSKEYIEKEEYKNLINFLLAQAMRISFLSEEENLYEIKFYKINIEQYELDDTVYNEDGPDPTEIIFETTVAVNVHHQDRYSENEERDRIYDFAEELFFTYKDEIIDSIQHEVTVEHISNYIYNEVDFINYEKKDEEKRLQKELEESNKLEEEKNNIIESKRKTGFFNLFKK